MSGPGPLLPRPAPEGARMLALHYLEEAAAAAPRLHADGDGEALHDFRVALRRLRSVLRAYEEQLGDTVGKKWRRRVSEIAAATGIGRDAEVQLAWVRARVSAAPPKTRAGMQWLAARIEGRMRRAYEEARAEVVPAFEKLADKLRERLGFYELRLALGQRHEGASFGGATGDLLRVHARDLGAWLDRIESAADDTNIHEARIAAKRLRYLLEPLADEVNGADALVKQLKGLQDVLGELHDTHVMAAELAEAIEVAAAERARRLHQLTVEGDPQEVATRAELRRDERAGLLVLSASVREDRDRLFAAFRDTWTTTASEAFLGAVHDLAEGMASQARGGANIERKYLLSALPDEVKTAPYVDIVQGYVPGGRVYERLRRVREGGKESYFRTVKLGHGLSRTEIEEQTTAAMFRRLWPLTRGKRLKKRRYTVAAGDRTVDVDVMTRGKRKVVIAEVELRRVDEQVQLPDYIEAVMVREVTTEPELEGFNLAT